MLVISCPSSNFSLQMTGLRVQFSFPTPGCCPHAQHTGNEHSASAGSFSTAHWVCCNYKKVAISSLSSLENLKSPEILVGNEKSCFDSGPSKAQPKKCHGFCLTDKAAAGHFEKLWEVFFCQSCSHRHFRSTGGVREKWQLNGNEVPWCLQGRTATATICPQK